MLLNLYDQITPRLSAGSFPNSEKNIPEAIDAVICLSRQPSNPGKDRCFYHLPLTYWEVADPISLLAESCILLKSALSVHQQILLHCRLGIDRTGLAILSLFVSEGLSPSEAISHYLTLRRCGLPRSDAMIIFHDFAKLYCM